MSLNRPLPSLRQLRHLVALAEHRHFGRAAEACLVTQSSLSASLKELETVLGRTLVERTRRSVLVTPLGEAVVARARAVLTAVDDIADLVAAEGGGLGPRLRLGVIPTVAPFLLPRVMPALRQLYPDLALYLREARSAELATALKDGALDLLLLAFPYRLDQAETHIFAEDPFWVAFPPGHRFAGRERLTPADLAGVRLLLLEEGHCLRSHALAACRAAGDLVEPGFQATSLHTLVPMVEGGIGLTLLPKMAIDAGILRGTGLQLRPLDGPGSGRRIGLAWRPSSPRKDAFLGLANAFRDELATPIRPGSGASPDDQ